MAGPLIIPERSRRSGAITATMSYRWYLLYEEPLPGIGEASTVPEIGEACHGETTLPYHLGRLLNTDKDSTKVNRSAIDEAASPLPLTGEMAVAGEYS